MKQPAYNLVTLFNVQSITADAPERVVTADRVSWVREIMVTDEAGNRIKLSLYADTFDALAMSDAEQYAAEQSYTAITMLADAPVEDVS